MRILIALLLLGGVAAAQPVEVSLKNQPPAGQKPSITLKAVQSIRQVRIELSRDDGKKFTVGHGALREGQTVTLPFGDARGGRAAWKGTLTLQLADGNGFTTDLTFETASVGDLKVTYRRDRLDLDGHVLEFQLSRPAGSAELHVFADDGSEVGSGTAKFSGEPAGTWLAVRWTPSSTAANKNVLRLDLRAVASDGPTTLVKLLPWTVAIPHEEVVFDTGQSAVKPSEEAKLDASYKKIVDAVEKVRKVAPDLPVKLFIAGHTDTVGGAADNRKLSLDRARAIASWFHDRGLPLPIAFAGFGEDALKVPTPDNTDELRNRRVDYIVGVEEPLVARGVRAEWRGVK